MNTDPDIPKQLEPDAQPGGEPVLYSHILQVIVSTLGLGQWAVIDDKGLNIIITAVWLVVSAVIAAKTRGKVEPLPKGTSG